MLSEGMLCFPCSQEVGKVILFGKAKVQGKHTNSYVLLVEVHSYVQQYFVRIQTSTDAEVETYGLQEI